MQQQCDRSRIYLSLFSDMGVRTKNGAKLLLRLVRRIIGPQLLLVLFFPYRHRTWNPLRETFGVRPNSFCATTLSEVGLVAHRQPRRTGLDRHEASSRKAIPSDIPSTFLRPSLRRFGRLTSLPRNISFDGILFANGSNA
jgi:hypothetical protein